ncbi:methyltransferase-like protein 7A isoform X2 [Neltuma alba]|uniref:methyltransferase-like protein 7A isoform X2 n=1 Tax=Neltuma alba TaxID=207710 RepID=UPI0010A37E81|nr:methyltransferase-like protein 7A isoform X2 [Prosopis alba]
MVLSSIPFVGFSLPSSQPFYEANSLTCSLSQRVDSGSPELAKSCFCCRRRRFLQSASMATTLFPIVPSTAAVPRSNYTVARYKAEIFSNLREKAHKILEIGIGTGPNLSYYASNSDVQVVGIDPNQKMEKYARSSAVSAGLPPSNFEFIHAVGEVIPLDDASVDAVVGTLVLCSVKDVSMTLQEIKRVLRPGGLYVIVEHVGAKEGTILRFIQRILDPLQQVLADGCHLCRDTESLISEAGFSRVELNTASLKKASFVNPHIYGLAYK